MVCLASFVGWLSSNPIPSERSVTILIVGISSALFVEMSVFTLNDYFNIEEDKISKPHRPIVAGEISANSALTLGIITLLLSIMCSFLVVLLYKLLIQFIIVLAALSLGILYDIWFKRVVVLGNIIVATLTAIPFIYGYYLYTEELLSTKALLFTLIAFSAALGREVVKGIVDMEGDRVVGVKTIATVWGAKTAAIVSSILMITAVLLSLYLFTYPTGTMRLFLFSIFITITNVIFVKSAIAVLRDINIVTAERVRRLSLIGMLTGIISFLVLV